MTHWRHLLQLIVGVVLIAGLFHFGYIDLRALTPALGSPGLVVAAVGMMFLVMLAGAERWYVLLAAQGIRLGRWRTYGIAFVSGFFNGFLPGACGGDLLRAGYLYHVERDRRPAAMLSLVMDRALGLGGAMLFAIAALIMRPAAVWPSYPHLGYVVAAGVAGLGLALAALMALARRRPRGTRSRGRFAKVWDELASALSVYARHRHVLGAGMLLSTLVCAMDAATVLLLAQAMGIHTLTPGQLAVAAIFALAANNIPLTPGGLGIGETAFANLCMTLESYPSGAPYATVFLAYRAASLLGTLPGFVLYLLQRGAYRRYTASAPS
jgi:glycosyltransferase 2 family protein